MSEVPQDEGDDWYRATQGAAAKRPRLTVDLDVDVCVIGGGLAGLTTAREVARLGWSVAVLEGGRIADGASGRNSGVVRPGFSCDVRKIVERVGLDRARALWALSEAGASYVRDTIRELDRPEIQPRRGWLDVSRVEHGDELLELVALLEQELDAAVEGWPTEQVRAVLRSDSYFHALHFPRAFHIDPLAYAQGLAAAAEAAGARIFENTPALEIDPAGVRKRISTPSARLRAGHIVLAANTSLAQLVPPLGRTVLPVTSYLAVTAPLGERLAEAVTYTGAVRDGGGHHYRIVGGDRLMWSGGADAWPRDPRRVARRFQAAIAQTFPQLGTVEIAHAASGAMGYAVHAMPQIGEVSSGLWLAGAFGAQGINTTAVAGNLIARAIVEGDDRWRIFFPYELVWAGGPLGRTVVQVGAFVRTRKAEIAAALARRRERMRRRESERAEATAARTSAAEARARMRASHKREAAE